MPHRVAGEGPGAGDCTVLLWLAWPVHLYSSDLANGCCLCWKLWFETARMN